MLLPRNAYAKTQYKMSFHFLQVTGLRTLYEKLTTSNKKLTAYIKWSDGETFENVAKSLSVAEATAQVYVIDTIVQGKGGEADYRRLLQEMDIGNRSFGMVTQLFSQSGLTLREIRETTSLTTKSGLSLPSAFVVLN